MMTAGILAYAEFGLVCLVILVLPFVPAFREWRHPTDAAPLPVLPNYTSDIDHFARRLQSDVKSKLGLGKSTGHEEFELVDHPAANVDWSKKRHRMISQAIATETSVRSAQQLYVEGSIRAGGGSAFPSLYATGDIDLGNESEIRDWAHADGAVKLGGNSVALRRISAGTLIELGTDSWFERMQAPTLYFGSRANRGLPPGEKAQIPADFAELPNCVQRTPALFLIRGDCALPAGRIYQGSLVVTGFLTIGAGTTVVGDIKARDGVSLDYQAQVKGALTCEKRIYLFTGTRVDGPVISESDLLVGTGAVVGLLDAHTTVSAANIIVEDGVVVHGAIWAHEIGMVKKA